MKLTWVPFILIILVQAVLAAPATGAAYRHIQGSHLDKKRGATRRSTPRSQPASTLPLPVSFRVMNERGLLADTWINGSGPYTFAIDTGAGGTLISEWLAAQLGISNNSGQPVSLSGLSGSRQQSGRESVIRTLALGDAENLLPAKGTVIISGGLPLEIDGILDPTEAYSPFGYIIDIPNHEMSAFDCALHPLSIRNQPPNGAVIHWLTNGDGRRPFVRLDDGRLVLLDTGSTFGLAVTQNSALYDRRNGRRVGDIGGGSVTSRRAEPSTISIGSLTLRRVPTDVLSGVEKGAPALLGCEALYPFRLTFDPVHRLIAIDPAER